MNDKRNSCAWHLRKIIWDIYGVLTIPRRWWGGASHSHSQLLLFHLKKKNDYLNCCVNCLWQWEVFPTNFHGDHLTNKKTVKLTCGIWGTRVHEVVNYEYTYIHIHYFVLKRMGKICYILLCNWYGCWGRYFFFQSLQLLPQWHFHMFLRHTF